MIQKIQGREILDSRGFPTVEVEVTLRSGHIGRAAVPSGASTGSFEAHELRDQKERFGGKGVLHAVENVNSTLNSLLQGKNTQNLKEIDELLIGADGTPNKSKLGANSILGVSLACAHAYSEHCDLPLFQSVRTQLGLDQLKQYKLPVPLMNVLNGGAHANNGLDIQEFMIVPLGFSEFKEALRAGAEIFQTLKGILKEKSLAVSVGDEGGFAPVLKNNMEALELLSSAIEKSGYQLGDQVALALDVASTEFFKDDQYHFEGKNLSASELGEIYTQWTKKFPLVSIEDGFAEEDWQGWSDFCSKQGQQLQLVGDDLFVTSAKRLQKGIELKAANALLVKVNQIGSLSEAQQAVNTAQKASMKTVMSHRSGETEDVTIADLAVAFNCEQIKTGSPCRSERTAKYNQLLRIEEALGGAREYWGTKAFS